MAQRKFHEKVQTWIVVTVISVLVWLYAEATVLNQTDRQIQVQFDDATGNYAVQPFAAQSIRVQFKASNAEIRKFNQATARPMIIPVEASGSEPVQEQTVILSARLIKEHLGEIGITDLTTTPETLPVQLRLLETTNLPILIDPDALEMIGGLAVAVPDRVSVTAPADVIDQLRNQTVTALLGEVPLNIDNPGRDAVAINVPLRFPDPLDLTDRWSTAEFRTIRVNYTPSGNNATTVRTRVPLFINLPVDQQNSFIVQPTDGRLFLRDVRLVGPADIIQAIENDDARYELSAELRIADLAAVAQSGTQTTIAYPVIRGAPNITTDPDPLGGIEVTVKRRGETP